MLDGLYLSETKQLDNLKLEVAATRLKRCVRFIRGIVMLIL